MSDARYALSQSEDGNFHLTRDDAAVTLSDYDRRILVGQLTRQLTDYHEKVTGPRERIGSDLTHNTRDAAAGIFGTLHRLDPEAAVKLADRLGGTPHAWRFGPVVDSEGYQCAGLYQRRLEPAFSPPAYANRYRVGPPITERDRILDRETLTHLRKLRIAGLNVSQVERPCSCERALRPDERLLSWQHLDGTPECSRTSEPETPAGA